MHSAIDTLYYQWATDEEDRSNPELLENIQDLKLEDKLDTLQGVLAYLATNLMEAQLVQTAVVDEYTNRALSDPEIYETSNSETISEAIGNIPEVAEVSNLSEEAANELDLFTKDFTQSIMMEVGDYEV